MSLSQQGSNSSTVSPASPKTLHKSSSIESPNKKQLTLFSSKVFKNDYTKQIIGQGSTETTVRCRLCQGSKEFHTESIYEHFKTNKHLTNTPEGEIEDLNELIAIFDSAREKNSTKKDLKTEKRRRDDTKNYVEFLAIGVPKNPSFSQVSEVRKYIQDLTKSHKNQFFKLFHLIERKFLRVFLKLLGYLFLQTYTKISKKTDFHSLLTLLQYGVRVTVV